MAAQRTRVLFLCIGNSCRSPMAEGFARTYGSDVLEAKSAGLAPAMTVQPLTRSVMLEKNIDVSGVSPKPVDAVMLRDVDLVINMSGQMLPAKGALRMEDWEVRDPIGESEAVYRQVRDEIERRVMRLILGLRASGAAVKSSG